MEFLLFSIHIGKHKVHTTRKLIFNSKTRGGNSFKETVRKEIQIINIRVEINHK